MGGNAHISGRALAIACVVACGSTAGPRPQERAIGPGLVPPAADARPEAAEPADPTACPATTTAHVRWTEGGRRHGCVDHAGAWHGPARDLRPDGSVWRIGAWDRGLRDGAWIERAWDGTWERRGSYRAGIRVGTWQQLGADGTPWVTSELGDGTGVWRTAWGPTRPRVTQTLRAGLAEGPFEQRDPAGTVVDTGSFVDGRRDGTRTLGNDRGMRISEQWATGTRTGERGVWRRGTLVLREHFDDAGLRHGPFETWRSQVLRREQGAYHHGVRAGIWRWTDRDGKLERDGAYLAGQRDGNWREFARGTLTRIVRYRAGMPDGQARWFGADGRLFGRSSFTAGTGEWRSYHPDGALAERTAMLAGQRHGASHAWGPRGTVLVDGSYQHDRREGQWQVREPGVGITRVTDWTAGQRHGNDTARRDDGAETVAQFAKGARAGTYTVRAADGQLRVRGQFVDDQRDGLWQSFDATGALAVRSTWRDGRLHGPYEARTSDGSITSAGEFVDGVPVGPWQVGAMPPAAPIQR